MKMLQSYDKRIVFSSEIIVPYYWNVVNY